MRDGVDREADGVGGEDVGECLTAQRESASAAEGRIRSGEEEEEEEPAAAAAPARMEGGKSGGARLVAGGRGGLRLKMRHNFA
jgi:phage protein D